jgi:hypothetical protein
MSEDHYLKAVTGLSETRKMVAICDVHSQSGIKLIGAGLQITSKMYDQLIQHKLLPSLDKALSMEGALNSDAILVDVLELLERSDRLMLATKFINKTDSLQNIIQSIKLPTPLAFKLTVAKEMYSSIYQKSLLLMVTSIYLAHCEDMSHQEKESIAIAALFQDIGLLHIDPKLLEPRHVMSVEERRHLYAHPLTAFLLLKEFPETSKLIANAVLEHHERVDGSGYPRGTNSQNISRYGQILAMAEIVAKSFDPVNQKSSWGKMDVILKLNSKKLGDGLVGHFNIFRNDLEDASLNESDPEVVFAQVKLVCKLFSDFNDKFVAEKDNEIYEFSQERLVELQLSLFSAGIDPRDPESLIQLLTNDPESITEYVLILNEAVWQFKSLLLDVSRRFPEVNEPSDSLESTSWRGEMKMTLVAAS